MTDYKQIRRELTRESIKSAALELAREGGWGAVTIRKIADRIHYTPPIVYEHFKNKDDVYHQLVKDGFDLLAQEVTAAVDSVEEPTDKLLNMAVSRYDFSVKNPVLHQLMFDSDNPVWHELELARYMTAIIGRVDGLIIEITGDSENVKEYAFNLICLTKGYSFFANHISKKLAPSNPLPCKSGVEGREFFINAVKRFIQSIKRTT